jgi:hypothetical protein
MEACGAHELAAPQQKAIVHCTTTTVTTRAAMKFFQMCASCAGPVSSVQPGSAGPSSQSWPQVPSREVTYGHDALLTPTSPLPGSPAPPLPTFSPPPALPSPPHEAPAPAPALATPPAAPPTAEERALHSLISSGLLALVVNLEGTLIDIVKPSSVTKWSADMQQRLHAAATSKPAATSGLFQLTVSRLWIKLRPGWHATLHRLSCFYCLWLVCTPF